MHITPTQFTLCISGAVWRPESSEVAYVAERYKICHAKLGQSSVKGDRQDDDDECGDGSFVDILPVEWQNMVDVKLLYFDALADFYFGMEMAEAAEEENTPENTRTFSQ